MRRLAIVSGRAAGGCRSDSPVIPLEQIESDWESLLNLPAKYPMIAASQKDKTIVDRVSKDYPSSERRLKGV
jgi:hypothetical protein